MNRRIKGFLRVAALAVIGLLLGASLYLVNARVVAGNPLPMPFGIGAAVVQSGSMEPAYHVGDLLLVKKQDAYAVGDVVVYQSGSMLVVHRIIAVNGSTVTTQGDANNAPDEPFDRSLIQGGVAGCIPGVGRIIDFVKTPLGILLLTGCAVLLLGLSFCRERQTREEKNAALRAQIRRLKYELTADDGARHEENIEKKE